MTISLKKIMEDLNKGYQDTINTIKELYPEWEPKGGIHAKLEFPQAQKVFMKHGFVLDFGGDAPTDNYVLRKSTNSSIKIAPDNPIIERKPETLTARVLKQFNDIQGEVVDPLKIKAELSQIEPNIIKAMAKVEKLSETPRNVKKTIVSDTLISDVNYLRTLLRGYKFMIRPSFGRRVRERLDALFLKVYPTNEFNQRFIAFNDKEVLYVFIINV